MTTDTLAPILSLSHAIQALTEAVEGITAYAPPDRAERVHKALERARRARTEVAAWADEARG